MKNHLVINKQYMSKLKLKRTSRIRLNNELCLIDQFEIDPIWDFETTVSLANKIGVPVSAIHKWNWNYRK